MRHFATRSVPIVFRTPHAPAYDEEARAGERCAPRLDVVRAVNSSRGTVVAERVLWATGSAKRRGLLGRDRLDAGEGMYLVPCRWIHMFGMRFPIDVAFLSGSGRILAVHHDLAPNRLSRLVWFAEGVLEIAAGALHATRTGVGDRIEFLHPQTAGAVRSADRDTPS